MALLPLLLVGKQNYLARLAASPVPRWVVDARGQIQPHILLAEVIVNGLLLSWLFLVSSGRKLKARYSSAFFMMSFAGILAVLTQLWLRL